MNIGLKTLVACGLLLCLRAANADQAHNSAVAALERSEGILRAGAIVTAQVTEIKNGQPDKTSTILERCYISGNKLRVDTIDAHHPGFQGRPTVTVQILSPEYKMSGQVQLRESYQDTNRLFSRLIASSPPAINANEGVPVTSARLPQVLGFNGTRWLGDKLRSATDGAVNVIGDRQVVTFGAKTPLLTEITYKIGAGLPEGYSYRPRNGNVTFTKFEIKKSLVSKNLPTYDANLSNSSRTAQYRVEIVSLAYHSIPDAVFRYADAEKSLYLRNGEKSVYTVVNSRRVKNYRPQPPQKERPPTVSPMAVTLIGAFVVCVGLLVAWFLKKTRG